MTLRYMVFIDGENLTIRGQEFAKELDWTLTEGDCYRRDVLLWFPAGRDRHIYNLSPCDLTQWHDEYIAGSPIRAMYYTSMVGDDDAIRLATESLWKLGFSPAVFKKARREQKAKGVDIALTKDMLSHAYLNNYDVALLIAGDGDYVPLVDEVKRLGKRVHLAFFDSTTTSFALKTACDRFCSLTPVFSASLSP
jgi:uncharacterized LabA/DUF88 family protein